MKRIYFFILFFIIFGLINTFSQPKENITFIISIDPDLFSKNSEVKINLYGPKEIKIAEETANCITLYNLKTKKEEIKCPEGIDYQRAKPEEFNVNLHGGMKKIEIKSDRISVGGKYRLYISGLSNDNCNRTSAQIEATVKTEKTILKGLPWNKTEMACPDVD